MYSNVVFASDYYFIWENTVLEIPVYDDLSPYIFKPKATLYYKGNRLNAEIEYLRGEGNDFSGLVNTSKVKNFHVNYRASSSEYHVSNCDGSFQTITFSIKDLAPPNIVLLKKKLEISCLTKKEDINYLKYFQVTDNYCKIEDITIEVDDTGVQYGRIGAYQTFLFASDKYNNRISAKMDVIIYDDTPPVLKIKEGYIIPLFFEYGKRIDLLSFVECNDDYDGNLINKVKIENEIDYNCLEIQKIQLSVVNASNLKTSLILEIKIVDKESPILNIKKELIELDYQLKLDKYIFDKYILKVEDNYDTLEIEDVVIDFSKVQPRVGIYEVYYSVVDSAGNKTTAILNVFLKSRHSPTIIVKEAIIKRNQVFNLSSYVVVEDPSDEEAWYNLKIEEGEVNTTVLGTYYLTLSCYNSSGNFAYEVLKVVVEEVENEDESMSDESLSEESFNDTKISNKDKTQPILLVVIGIIAGTSIFTFVKEKIAKNKN